MKTKVQMDTVQIARKGTTQSDETLSMLLDKKESASRLFKDFKVYLGNKHDGDIAAIKKETLRFLMNEDYRKEMKLLLHDGKEICIKCSELMEPEYKPGWDGEDVEHYAWSCKCGEFKLI